MGQRVEVTCPPNQDGVPSPYHSPPDPTGGG